MAEPTRITSVDGMMEKVVQPDHPGQCHDAHPGKPHEAIVSLAPVVPVPALLAPPGGSPWARWDEWAAKAESYLAKHDVDAARVCADIAVSARP